MQFDWEVVGSVLLERERRPLVVADRSGRIVRANHALRLFLEAGTCSDPSPPIEDLLHAESREAFRAAWGRALVGERPRVAVMLRPSVSPLELVFELIPLAQEGVVRSVMMVMIDALTPSSSLPLVPPQGSHYEVSLDREGRPDRLVRALSAEPLPRFDRAAACYRVMQGSDRPCEGCPVSKLSKGGATATVRLDSHHPFKAQLLSARRVRDDLATVSVVPIDETVYSQLVESRITALAETAKLTERERHVLSLLLLGRTLDDIAEAEGISARTAKYHQQNLLRKAGAESRLDLFRLLR